VLAGAIPTIQTEGEGEGEGEGKGEGEGEGESEGCDIGRARHGAMRLISPGIWRNISEAVL
jgi:hypothetical protein